MMYLNGKNMYIFTCIDMFSKYANPNSTAIILRYVLNGMGIPKVIVSDDGGEFEGRFKQILDAEGIDHIVMTTNLSFIDRFVRTEKLVI